MSEEQWGHSLQKLPNGLRVNEAGRVCIPPNATDMCVRFRVIAHFGLGGHRGVATTVAAIAKGYYWPSLEDDVKAFIQRCLPCASEGSGQMRRPWGEALHADRPNELIHMDYVFMGPSKSGMLYTLVIKDDASKYVWLLPSIAANSDVTVDSLLK